MFDSIYYDANAGADLGDEHLLNLRHSLHLWVHVSRVHAVVGGEDFGFFLSPLQRLHLCICGRGRYIKVHKVKSAPHHVVEAPWRSGLIGTFNNPLEVSSSPSAFCFVFEK